MGRDETGKAIIVIKNIVLWSLLDTLLDLARQAFTFMGCKG